MDISFVKIKCFFCVIILSQALISCQKKCDGEDYKLRARIEIKIKNDEVLKVNYISDKGDKNWKQIEIDIQGNLEKQFIEFCFKEAPVDFNFSYSINNKQIGFYSILLENELSQKFIDSDKINLYFRPNEALNFQKNNNTYSIDKSSNAFIKPIVRSRNALKNILLKKLKNTN